VVAQIDRDVAVLRDLHASHSARIDALRFLIHFVGDLHQPLHAADRHDRGGNSVVVYQGRHRSNLHRVWDEDVVEALGADAMADAAQIETGLSSQDKGRIMTGTPAEWANETFQVAVHEIYARLPGSGTVRLPRDYTSRERSVVQLQLGRAGFRLAMILNAIYR
jgi:hypothetical protein